MLTDKPIPFLPLPGSPSSGTVYYQTPIMKVTDFVHKDNAVHFNRYRQGQLYYRVRMLKSTRYFEFTVPVDDLGEATIEATEKSVFCMRYIRKALEAGTLVEVTE